ncbi:MAG: hypothetical protein PVG99_10475 [Desulfobacteraceae bacterium]|jgi:hypothetical protein
MKKTLLAVLLVLFCLSPLTIRAQEGASYGPFSAIKMDSEVVVDVLAEANDIYVKVAESYWDADFTVKISNDYMTSYRQWLSGAWEMPVKVYRSHKRNKQGYTYRINTAAKFVEYWMDGRLVLHLERVR